MAIKTIIIIIAEITMCALLSKLAISEGKKDRSEPSWAIIDGEFIDFAADVGEDA